MGVYLGIPLSRVAGVSACPSHLSLLPPCLGLRADYSRRKVPLLGSRGAGILPPSEDLSVFQYTKSQCELHVEYFAKVLELRTWARVIVNQCLRSGVLNMSTFFENNFVHEDLKD